MTFIDVQNLKYHYPHQEKLALNQLTFSIEKGEFIGLIGENGAGKSTLCNAIMGLVPHFYKGAYGGRVTIADGTDGGIEVAHTPVAELCQKVGLVFQNPFNQLSGAKLTVYEEIAFGLQNMGVPSEEIHRRVTEVLELLDITLYRNRNPFDLSGGQMQRVALASILVMKPEILVLDEPTSQLDPAASEEVFRAIEVLKKSGITIIMAEQKMEKLAVYCDRILLMHQGELVDFDTPERIFSRPDLLQYGICPPLKHRIMQKGAEILTEFGWRQKIEQKPEETFDVKELSFSYFPEIPVIKELNLQLDSRITAIVGQNGAGKTTLVKLLKGLLKPVSGSIYYKQEDITGKTIAMLAKDVGYVFQNPDDQIFKYKVLEEVMFGPLNIGMDKEIAKEQALKALAMTGLTGKEEQNPYDLELPERKMVSIASVLAMNTDVLILDEPTIAQDYRGRETLKCIIGEQEQQGKSVISILHDMDFVYDCFERIIVMAGGQIIGDGSGDSIFRQTELLKQAGLEPPAVITVKRE